MNEYRRQAETAIKDNVHALALIAGIINTDCPEGMKIRPMDLRVCSIR